MAFFTSTFLAVTAIAATVVGTAVSVYGQQQAAKQAEAIGKYNARLAENEARNIELEARETIRRKRIENQRFIAGQRSGYAAAGVTIEGTPLEVMSETAGILELEVQDYNRQQQVQAQQLRAQGAAGQYSANAQASAYRINAASSLLQGVGSTASTILKING